MKLVIPGEPIAKARAKFFTRGEHIIGYDPQAADKEVISQSMTDTLIDYTNKAEQDELIDLNKLISSPALSVEFTFHMPIPNSWSVKKRNLASWGRFPHRSKPDVDNLVKFYLDCGNNALWGDDATVQRVTAKKIYSDTPATYIEIKPMEENFNKHVDEVLSCIGYEELSDLDAAFEIIHDCYDRCDTVNCCRVLEQVAAKYVKPLEKINKLVKKKEKLMQELDESERV